MAGKKFELKSGNKPSFKEMGSSPLKGADATLVSAAQTAAMAKKPGDWSAHYDKAAEGQLAAFEGKQKMIGDIGKVAGQAGAGMMKAHTMKKASDASETLARYESGELELSQKEIDKLERQKGHGDIASIFSGEKKTSSTNKWDLIKDLLKEKNKEETL